LHVGERFYVAVTFAHNDDLEAEKINDISIVVLPNNNLFWDSMGEY
jgi:hypothetical protein